MRSRSRCLLLALFLFNGLLLRPLSAADPVQSVEGKWKLIFLMQDLELSLFEVKPEGDGFTASIIDSFNQIGKTEAKSFTLRDGVIELVLQTQTTGELRFKGKAVVEGDDAGAVLGVLWLRGSPLPARLDKTEADKVEPPKQAPSPAQLAFRSALQTPDPQKKIEKLLELIPEAPAGLAFQAYSLVIATADGADLTEDDVRKYLSANLDLAGKYGPEWVVQCRSSALQGIAGKKRYSALGLELAELNYKALPADASLDDRANVLQALSRAARVAEKQELAETVERELAVVDAKLDEEYHHKVPPFAPEKFTGRDNPEHNRVVVFELFTGAQCPPCVAADVAFDALLSTYQHTELIALQYHLHIPGPDPLTNADSESRAKFYSVRGTPSTYFNGKNAAGGGGGMAQSKSKYDQFRAEIDTQLAGAKAANVDLKLERQGDRISLKVFAQADVKDEPKDESKESENDKGKNTPDLRVRVVLTEETIRYVGGNRLRFHHHVVRGFPGGIEGQPMENGSGKVDLTVDLNDVRAALNDYVENQNRGPFANTPPKLDFKNLSVVAFVQDDSDKSILHAVQASIPETK